MGTCLVTGASRGIGAAIARELASRGRSLILTARGVEGLEAAAAALRESGARVATLAFDVADEAAFATVAERVRDLEQDLGPLEALVNNAGIAISAPLQRSADFEGGDLYERHLAVNFHGPRRLTEALLPRLLETGGRVLNVASSAGLVGYAYVSAYCASKHALLGYTRAAALELGPKGLSFGAVCPHYVDSPMLAASVANVVAKTGQSEQEARAFFASQNPDGSLVTEAQVAQVVGEWIASGQNGAVLELTGERVLERS